MMLLILALAGGAGAYFFAPDLIPPDIMQMIADVTGRPAAMTEAESKPASEETVSRSPLKYRFNFEVTATPEIAKRIPAEGQLKITFRLLPKDLTATPFPKTISFAPRSVGALPYKFSQTFPGGGAALRGLAIKPEDVMNWSVVLCPKAGGVIDPACIKKSRGALIGSSFQVIPAGKNEGEVNIKVELRVLNAAPKAVEKEIFWAGTIAYEPAALAPISPVWMLAFYRSSQDSDDTKHTGKSFSPLAVVGPLPLNQKRVAIQIPAASSRHPEYFGSLRARLVPCNDPLGDYLRCTESGFFVRVGRDSPLVLETRSSSYPYRGTRGEELIIRPVGL